MTYPPQQQPPVTPGYNPHPPNNDWVPAPRPSRRSALPWIIAALAVLVADGVLAYTFLRDDAPQASTGPAQPAVQAADPQPFEATRDSCDPDFKGTTIGDRGKTLIIDGGQGLPADAIGCLFSGVGAPQSVIAQVEGTRALDGRQTATWTGFSASWTYHPDQGLDAIITATS